MGFGEWIRKMKRGCFQVIPGALLLLTFVDDAVFGSLMVGARLAFGTQGLVIAAIVFVVFSIMMAGATSWALTKEPLVLSLRSRARISSITSKRFGRYLVPHPDRITTTAVGAAVFGSVAPIIVASLEEGRPVGNVGKLTAISGISYGLFFASGYGIIGAIAGTAV
jgi:hypothetical protein